MLLVRETFINESKGYQFGSSDFYEAFTDERKRLFRDLQREYGRCVSAMYIDARNGEAKPIGWVFQKRMQYGDARRPYTDKDYYIREVWVEVREVVADANEVALQDNLISLD